MRNLFLPGVLFALASPALAFQEAEAKLFTRTQGSILRAAIVIEIEPGAHIYHGPTKADLGHPDAVGQPTRVKLLGGGIDWSEVYFPEPMRHDQSEFGEGVFINAHEGELVLFVAGRVNETGAEAKFEAELKGLVCDAFGCMPYKEVVDSSGTGADSIWAAYPDDLLAPPARNPASSASSAATAGDDVPKADKITGGNADASLYTRIVDGVVRLALEIKIKKRWHLYHFEKGNEDGIGSPTVIELKGAGVTWGELQWPTPHELDQSDIIDGAWIYSHEGTIVLFAEGELAAGGTGKGIWGTIKGQTCDDASCLPYKETFVDQGKGSDAIWVGFPVSEEDATKDATKDGAGAQGESEEPGDSEESETEQLPLGLFLLEAIGWGLFTLLMPCTYPMIPITISFFTKQADARHGKVWPLAATYGAGIVLVFILIGVVVGQIIVPFAQHPITNLTIGAFFIVFGLSLLGLFTLNPPRFLLNVAGQASLRGGFVGVFLMGTCLVVTSFTCTAPFVGTLLARGAADGDLLRVVLGMGVFGLTMAIPFVVLSLVPGRVSAMPKSGEWMNALKVTLGFVELAAALKFISNSDLGWGWNVISRELFLIAWTLIFVAAALYLLGFILRKGAKPQIGYRRRSIGVLTLAFAAYCGWGAYGNEMDPIMASVYPPYSGGRIFPTWYEFGGDWELVKDDYDDARERAVAEGKLLFVNFTGFT